MREMETKDTGKWKGCKDVYVRHLFNGSFSRRFKWQCYESTHFGAFSFNYPSDWKAGINTRLVLLSLTSKGKPEGRKDECDIYGVIYETDDTKAGFLMVRLPILNSIL